jgi:hypothetical protein
MINDVQFSNLQAAEDQPMNDLELILFGLIADPPDEPIEEETIFRYNANPMSILAAGTDQNMGALSLSVIGTVDQTPPLDPPGFIVLTAFIKQGSVLEQIETFVKE